MRKTLIAAAIAAAFVLPSAAMAQAAASAVGRAGESRNTTCLRQRSSGHPFGALLAGCRQPRPGAFGRRENPFLAPHPGTPGLDD